jgi:hypothetical protein
MHTIDALIRCIFFFDEAIFYLQVCAGRRASVLS